MAKLFLLDGMALIYRAHFALIRNPMFNSKGLNTSAIYGFVNTLLDILDKQEPTHIAIAFDTPEPTARHKLYEPYKAQREDMPEDIAASIPEIRRIAEAFNIPLLEYPGYEADDVIGTLARKAEAEQVETFMVTPDKDFAQLVSDHVFMFKPARQGSGAEVLGVEAVNEKWGVPEPSVVADILGLWGDASDNIPGVPGIGEKTAKKLIGQYGSMDNLIAHIDELKGKQKENMQTYADQARLSRQLATIDCEVPVVEKLEDLAVQPMNRDAINELMLEYEFTALGKRVLGEGYKGSAAAPPPAAAIDSPPAAGQGELLLNDFQTLHTTSHDYQLVDTPSDRQKLIKELLQQSTFCFDLETTSLDTKTAEIVGIAFCYKAHTGFFVTVPEEAGEAAAILEEFRPVFEHLQIEKIGHNLKYDLGVLKWQGMQVKGPLFDTLLNHYLVDPESRHRMDYLAEVMLGYSPIPISTLIGDKKSAQKSMRDVPVEDLVDYAVEDADITFQLRQILEPQLKEKGQEQVFYDIEIPLIQVLIDMEYEGVALDVETLQRFSGELSTQIDQLKQDIESMAGGPFNLNSPKQLGEVLFDKLKIVEKPKKTKTGQYATNEQVLTSLVSKHEIIPRILDYREAAKLKSTYVDALPGAVFSATGRVHTHYTQTGAATGRLASNDPNLQNIPIRTELGREIRKAFVARNKDYLLLSADYSQVELRVVAELSKDAALREAFESGHDIHAATAARVYGISLDEVSPDMRRKAKMVNFGIIYGISAFGLAQRLGVGRAEAGDLIKQYFAQYPGVRAFLDATIAFCKDQGYVETMTGRRRYIRDINSANATVRGAAERTAINSPIQGTAADMIKLAMNRIHQRIQDQNLKSRMILQVHDELVFDMHKSEEPTLRALVEECMVGAIPLEVPVEVDMGTGFNWLEAH